MSTRKMVPHDGNSAVAHVAHALNEVIAIYPITPSSDMGEHADAKSAAGQKNIWGTVPEVVEMQSEAGAAGAVHGALTSGALTTTFTASQGLLLMIPNMYKIAGELLPSVFHIAARAIACQALSIFGDHSDVMSTRSTGWGMLASANVQEAMDMALISHSATLKARVPFLHFFEGFRISHEIQKVEELTFDDMRSMINDDLVKAHKERGLSPDHPVVRGTSQNPDVYFQGRETVNEYYDKCPAIVQETMDEFAKLTGRQYNLFDYVGAEDAEKVVIMMGSGSEVVHETAEALNRDGQKTGVLKVRLYRPFSIKDFIKVLPKTVKKVAVLDRTKEPGSIGEPLYIDVRTAIGEAMTEGLFDSYPTIVGGRFGLGSAEFTPAMAKAVFDNLDADKPKNHFTVGILDDITGSSLEFDPSYNIDDKDLYSAMFYGLGSDGTVGANKNSIKIIGELTDNKVQGYFVYDSKKAGTITTSHLRFGKKQIRSPYLISKANFLACHNFSFLEKYNMLRNLDNGNVFLLNAPYSKDEVWAKLPAKVQKQIIDKKLKFYVIDAIKIAEEIGLGGRINVIMQTAFFKISNIIDLDKAIETIKAYIKKSYGKKGDAIVNMNNEAVDQALDKIEEVEVPASFDGVIEDTPVVVDSAPDFVKEVTAKILSQQGDCLKVSQIPNDGTWPTGTTQYEKRNIATHIPAWNQDTCIQCGRCSLVCPHAVIRPKVYEASLLDNAPSTFKSAAPKGIKSDKDLKYTLQVAPEDCTGCGACVSNCPAAAKEAIKMVPQPPLRAQEKENFEFFLSLPETDPSLYQLASVKGSQFVKPLFEFSGACAGCGETAYVKLLSQLFGDRALIANATGCSSIYGGNLPTTPYTTREDGLGPAWINSLFEDNAEVSLGMKLATDKFQVFAAELSDKICESSNNDKLKGLLAEVKDAKPSEQAEIEALRTKIADIKKELASETSDEAKQLLTVCDYMVEKSVWALGGDGWAYDIGYGGLDHVLASGRNINIFVMDTEVYSNTGGQASKATPIGAVAKFAAGGKPTPKKDMAMIAMSYGYIYVAKIAIGADPNQAVKAIKEAEAFDGPSLILAYSHCIAHGINMVDGLQEQKNAVASGHWPLLRYNPALIAEGKNPLIMDSKDPSMPLKDYVFKENRYRILQKANPEAAEAMVEEADVTNKQKIELYKQMANIKFENPTS